ncbi:MAG TPA: hypothetical protein VFE36_03785 [Candidatus Baltobacteraceae bacterium]|nr:hypothetical protein [Candidatus Baltobacteraceae bacterium]
MMRLTLFVAAVAMILTACGGPAEQAGGALQVNQATSTGVRYYHVTRSDGVAVDLAIRARSALPESSIGFQPIKESERALRPSRACPTVPPLQIFNPHSYPTTIELQSFTVQVHCALPGTLFGASFVQIKPQPAVVSPIKLADATASNSKITFTPVAKSIMLAPRTRYEVLVVSETSTSAVAFPVVPGSTTNLTANAPAITSGPTFNGLTFKYSSSSGAATYSAACFPAFSDGVLEPFLQNVPLVGTPSFFCQLSTPNNAVVTFGQTVTFNVLSPPPDRALFEPDGQPQGFACGEPTNNASSCNVPQFSTPTTYQNFIVGNVQDLRLCFAAKLNTDCNTFGTDPQGGALTKLRCCGEFQLLVADDPTYKPPTSSAQPWDGLFRMSFTAGVCVPKVGPDADDDAPPGYSDNQKGIGPAAELDVKVLAPGTCTITVTEDSRYILDDGNPSAPKPRSATIALPVAAIVHE